MHRKRHIRVLVIDNSPGVTGALTAIMNALKPEDGRIDASFVLPRSSAGIAVLQREGYRVDTLPFIEISRNIGRLIAYAPMLIANGWRISRLVKQQHIDVVHLNDFYNLTGIVSKLFGSRARFVTHVRLIPQRYGALARLWSLLHLRFSDQIICVSEAVRSYFPRSHEKVIVISDPIPERERYNSRLPNRATAKSINLLYLANYIRGKGQDLALIAFKRAIPHVPALRLTFVGGDLGLEKNRHFRRELENLADSLGLLPYVTFQPYTEDTEKAIKQADIVLNFSQSESFSMTCLEALFYGTPLIATDCGGPAELFEHGNSGLLVPNGDVDAMTHAIVELASNAAMQEEFSRNGRAFVMEKFGRDRTARRLVALYESLAEP